MIHGHYHQGQYVLVQGKKDQEELVLLGCFGTDLENAKRKETRRGPSDQELVDYFKLDHFLASHEQTTALTLHEAFFLIYSFGCLELKFQDKPLDVISSWNQFRQYHAQSNIPLDFAIEYGVYHYFKSRGWVVKAGTNYGTNFTLYKDGPSQDHAQYAVLIVYDDKNGVSATCGAPYNWTSLLTFHRVCQSVNKELLLAFVTSKNNFDSPECIGQMKIVTMTFAAAAGTITSKQSADDRDGCPKKSDAEWP